jgi:hypothetical protein
VKGDVRGPEEQGAGTVETLFLDVISARHQSVDPSVPGQPSRASPSLWKVGSAECARSYYISPPSLSGVKSRKSVGISTMMYGRR